MANKILELLEPEAVCLNMEANDPAEVINTLSARLEKTGYVHSTFAAAAMEREKVMPTGLPLAGEVNAAIPHTEIEHVIKPGLALATLTKPVNFHNMVSPTEDVPVRLVFVMALDKPKAQVEMLKEIASVLQNTEVIDQLVKSKNYLDIKNALKLA